MAFPVINVTVMTTTWSKERMSRMDICLSAGNVSSNNGVNGNQLANYMDVNVKIARKFSKKCRILMAESNITKFIL